MILPWEKAYRGLEAEADALAGQSGEASGDEVVKLRQRAAGLRDKALARLSDWDRVLLARHPGRPRARSVVERCLTRQARLGGPSDSGAKRDRASAVGALGWIGDERVVALGLERPAHGPWQLDPGELRRLVRWVSWGEAWGLRPLVLVDTAECQENAYGEEHFEAFGVLRAALARRSTPALSVVMGEVNGELGAACTGGTRVLMLEHAVWSLCRPEQAARDILGDPQRVEQAAAALQLRTAELQRRGLVAGLVPEPAGGAHRDPDAACRNICAAITAELRGLP